MNIYNIIKYVFNNIRFNNTVSYLKNFEGITSKQVFICFCVIYLIPSCEALSLQVNSRDCRAAHD